MSAPLPTVLVPLRLPVKARSRRELRDYLLQPIPPDAVIVGIQPGEASRTMNAVVQLPDQLSLDLNAA